MRLYPRGLAALCALAFIAGSWPASAANAPNYSDQAGTRRGAQGVICVKPDGAFCDPSAPVLGAGEAHIGEVGGNIVVSEQSPTVTASSAYSAGNVVGSLLTFADAARVAAGTGLLQDVTIYFKSAQTAQTDFMWCGASNVPNTTLTDKSAVSLSVSDFDKCRAIPVVNCTSLGTPSVCTAGNLAFPFKLSSGTSGYGFLVTRGTPTFGSTSDVKVAVRIIRN